MPSSALYASSPPHRCSANPIAALEEADVSCLRGVTGAAGLLQDDRDWGRRLALRMAYERQMALETAQMAARSERVRAAAAAQADQRAAAVMRRAERRGRVSKKRIQKAWEQESRLATS